MGFPYRSASLTRRLDARPAHETQSGVLPDCRYRSTATWQAVRGIEKRVSSETKTHNPKHRHSRMILSGIHCLIKDIKNLLPNQTRAKLDLS
jgi:hypothetical protein